MCIDDFALKKRYSYGTVMIDIETHKIVDILNSRDEEQVTEWLKQYQNLEVISRDGGIMYKSASMKAHPDAIHVSDRFHILKNLTDYARSAIKRILKGKVSIKKDTSETVKSESQEKTKVKTKWELILEVKELKEKNYTVQKIREALGLGVATIVKYSKIPLEDKEKYTGISTEKLVSKTNEESKWELIQQVQKEYKECLNYSKVAKKFGININTVRRYVKITEPPVQGTKGNKYGSKLSKYESTIIKMNNEGHTSKVILKSIQEDGYNGSYTLLKMYLAKIRKECKEGENEGITINKNAFISLLYKKIDDVKNLTEDVYNTVLEHFPQIKIIYELVESFKEMLRNKEHEKLEEWIIKAKKYNIQEINSFINGIKRDFAAVKNGIKYEYNNGLAEGSVNKIKVIKRIMYGRCGFELLRQKVLL